MVLMVSLNGFDYLKDEMKNQIIPKAIGQNDRAENLKPQEVVKKGKRPRFQEMNHVGVTAATCKR